MTRIILIKNPKNRNPLVYDRFTIYCEHMGLLIGGSWNPDEAIFMIDPHEPNCVSCNSRIVHTSSITEDHIAAIESWCIQNDLEVEAIMTEDEYDKYELSLMEQEIDDG